VILVGERRMHERPIMHLNHTLMQEKEKEKEKEKGEIERNEGRA
jgi:hypothetical protein